MRTSEEIKAEIAALKALKPVGTFKEATDRKIGFAVEELQYGVDTTADEWSEMDDAEQDIVNQTRLWKEGDSEEKPSEGWGPLVAKSKK